MSRAQRSRRQQRREASETRQNAKTTTASARVVKLLPAETPPPSTDLAAQFATQLSHIQTNIKTQDQKIEALESATSDVQTKIVKQGRKIEALQNEYGNRRAEISELDTKLEELGKTGSELVACDRLAQEVLLGMLEEYMHLKGLFPSLPAVESEDKNAPLRRL